MSNVIGAAFRTANSINIGVEHLFLSLLNLDPSLITKFKIKGFDRTALIREMRSIATTAGPRDHATVVDILHLSSRISLKSPANNQHILLALILGPLSPVSRYLAQSGIDLKHLLQRKFYFYPRALELCRGWSESSNPGKCYHCQNPRAVLSELFSKLVEAKPVSVLQKPLRCTEPLMPRHPMAPNAEQTAVKWLESLIPGQAELYATKRYIEIPSTLYPGNRYRIGKNNRTVMIRNGEKIATYCIQTRDRSIPQTDRVIGEYFFIRGDENAYLKIANITPVQ